MQALLVCFWILDGPHIHRAREVFTREVRDCGSSYKDGKQAGGDAVPLVVTPKSSQQTLVESDGSALMGMADLILLSECGTEDGDLSAQAQRDEYCHIRRLNLWAKIVTKEGGIDAHAACCN